MGKALASIRIDVDKITKDKIFVGQKGKYLDLTVSINDEPNQYGQNISVWEKQSDDERNNDDAKNYLGNGKIFWSDGGAPRAQQAPAQNNDDDSLPF